MLNILSSKRNRSSSIPFLIILYSLKIASSAFLSLLNSISAGFYYSSEESANYNSEDGFVVVAYLNNISFYCSS